MVQGICEAECSALLKDFFRALRERRKKKATE
jgi:tRNA(adenine34) deaminase